MLESDFIATSTDSPSYDHDIHGEYAMALCYNRLHQLRAILTAEPSETALTSDDTDSEDYAIDVHCKAPLRATSSNWPYYIDNTVFGENYSKMKKIITPHGSSSGSWQYEVNI